MVMPTVLMGSGRCCEVTMISCNTDESEEDTVSSAAKAPEAQSNIDPEVRSLKTEALFLASNMFICENPIPTRSLQGRTAAPHSAGSDDPDRNVTIY
jgi:hypothetical protein